MRYCKRCVQPDTRPGIVFSDDGICGACLWEDEKKHIDWNGREKEIQDISEKAKTRATGPYNCVIGVSGGKDSTFQAVYARDTLGLHPLLVNGEPDNITEIGRFNIENLKNLGFDVISLRPNPKILRQLARKDFFNCLNPVRVMEYPLWASAYIIAVKFNIPLIIQGENAGQTLGTSADTGTGGDALSILRHNTLKADPIETYALDGITKDDLFMYSFRPEELFERDIQAIWLSYYCREWSQPHNAAFAMARGLKIRPMDTDPYNIGTYRLFSQLDGGSLIELNQMLKYIKFGFGQATDHACYDVRDGLISRDEAVFLVQELDGRCGEDSLDQFCRYIEISKDEFWNHANTFRGSMWRKDVQGNWRLDSPAWEQTPVEGEYTVRGIMKRLGM